MLNPSPSANETSELNSFITCIANIDLSQAQDIWQYADNNLKGTILKWAHYGALDNLLEIADLLPSSPHANKLNYAQELILAMWNFANDDQKREIIPLEYYHIVRYTFWYDLPDLLEDILSISDNICKKDIIQKLLLGAVSRPKIINLLLDASKSIEVDGKSLELLRMEQCLMGLYYGNNQIPGLSDNSRRMQFAQILHIAISRDLLGQIEFDVNMLTGKYYDKSCFWLLLPYLPNEIVNQVNMRSPELVQPMLPVARALQRMRSRELYNHATLFDYDYTNLESVKLFTALENACLFHTQHPNLFASLDANIISNIIGSNSSVVNYLHARSSSIQQSVI